MKRLQSSESSHLRRRVSGIGSCTPDAWTCLACHASGKAIRMPLWRGAVRRPVPFWLLRFTGVFSWLSALRVFQDSRLAWNGVDRRGTDPTRGAVSWNRIESIPSLLPGASHVPSLRGDGRAAAPSGKSRQCRERMSISDRRRWPTTAKRVSAAHHPATRMMVVHRSAKSPEFTRDSLHDQPPKRVLRPSLTTDCRSPSFARAGGVDHE